MLIPVEQLSDAALQGLIEEFVTRDGTDYGDCEASLESKVAQVRRQLASGDAVILFSQSKGVCNIVPKSMLE